MSIALRMLVGGALLTCCFGPLYAAEQATSPTLVNYLQVQVRPEAAGQYEDFLHKLVAAAKQAERPQTWIGHTPAFGAGGRYLFVQFPAAWTDLDQPFDARGMLSGAFGDAEADRLLGVAAASQTASESGVFEVRDDLSETRYEDPPEGFVWMLTMDVIPGQQATLEAFMRKVREASAKAGSQQNVYVQTQPVGSWDRYVVVRLAPRISDFYTAPSVPQMLEQAYGAEESARLLASATAARRSANVAIWAQRNDLSNLPPME